MRARVGCLVSLVVWCGCATYSQDLERARIHYRTNEFGRALALLRVLGDDFDALSAHEQAQYAYLRGMTDLRLASTLSERDRASQEQFVRCARDWLTVAGALAKDDATQPAALTADQRMRLSGALEELGRSGSGAGACLSPAARSIPIAP